MANKIVMPDSQVINIVRHEANFVGVSCPDMPLVKSCIRVALSSDKCALAVGLSTSRLILWCTSLKPARRIARSISNITKIPCLWDLPMNQRS